MTKIEKDKYSEFLETTNGDEEKASHLFLKWKCITDLYFLGVNILGLGKGVRNGRKVLDPTFHRWLATLLQTKEDVMILVPRGHMKSTWVKYAIIQDILKNPNIRIGLFSATASLVEAHLTDLKRLFQTPKLMQLFPEIIPEPGKKFNNWERSTQEVLTLRRDPTLGHVPQEGQIEVAGVGKNIVGRHYDKHYYDDLVNPQTISTMEQINKTKDWYSYIQAVLTPGGQEIVIATPYHYADLYASIEREKIYKKIYKRPCIERGKPIYKFFTLKDFKKLKKRMGNYEFSCQYMINPIPDEDRVFPPPYQTFNALPKERYNYYITIDPAATTKKYSDETAIIVGAVNSKGWLYVVHALHFKKPGNDIARMIIELNQKYNPVSIGIEFGLQEHLKHIISLVKSNVESVIQDTINLPIESIQFTHKSKFDRINYTFGAFFREGKVWIKSDLHDLMLQMERFQKNYSGKDDLVDAVSMQFQIIKQFSFRYWKKPLGKLNKDWFTLDEIFAKDKKTRESIMSV